MHLFSSLAAGALLMTLLCACASSAEKSAQDASPPPRTTTTTTAAATPPDMGKLAAPKGRIVAIGDLHGDLDSARRVLRLAGAIDAQDHWIGKDLTVVQTGDEIDRGDGDKAILDLFDTLTAEAAKAGGQVIALNGNHEIMNAQGDFRYVTPGGFASFAELKGLDTEKPPLNQLPAQARARGAAFVPGGPYAGLLAKRPTILVLGDNVFVHGGVLPQHVDYGLTRINHEVQAWLSGKAGLPSLLSDEQGPIWTRLYSDTTASPACDQLAQTLGKIGARRMIVGHTVQPQINGACENRVWRIDVGMSKAYGGPIQALAIDGEHVTILKETH